jgi:hypothetical protein
MLYCITFRSQSDARITGWYTGNNGRWSTDHTRKKLFDQKEEAEPVAMALRERCPANAENIKVRDPSRSRPHPRRGIRTLLCSGFAVGAGAAAAARQTIPSCLS